MILITIKVPFCYFKDIFHLDGKKWKTIGIKEIDNSTEHDQTFYMWPTFWQHIWPLFPDYLEIYKTKELFLNCTDQISSPFLRQVYQLK